MGRGGHGLSKVSPRPAMSNPSTPCGRATTKTALWLFRGWRALRMGGLRASTPLDTPRRTGLSQRWHRRIRNQHRRTGKGLAGPSDTLGECHDQGEAKWIVVRRSLITLWGHSDMPFGRPPPGRPIGRPHSVFGVWCFCNYY
jgi:hypothetical protein